MAGREGVMYIAFLREDNEIVSAVRHPAGADLFPPLAQRIFQYKYLPGGFLWAFSSRWGFLENVCPFRDLRGFRSVSSNPPVHCVVASPRLFILYYLGEGVLFNENGKVEKEHNNKRAYPAKRKQTQF